MSDELREFDKTQEQPHVLRAELDRVKSEAAALREALCKFRRTADCYDSGNGVNLPLLEARWVADAALSNTAGSDYVSKADVRPIAEALATVDREAAELLERDDCEIECEEVREMCRDALSVARKLGLLEQPRNKPCSKCGSRMQVSYGEPDNKEIMPPHWWCRHCGHEEDK